jgi:hypothetical protein
VKYNANFADQTRETYLTFDTSLLSGTLASAKVKLFGGMQDNRAGNLPIDIYGAPTNWDESTLTWNNKPSPTTGGLYTRNIIDQNQQWYDWDVTGYVNSQRALGNFVVSFVLKTSTQLTPYATFASSEAAANAPELLMST